MMWVRRVSGAARLISVTLGRSFRREGPVGIVAGLTVIAGLSFLLLFTRGISVAEAQTVLNCTVSNAGPTGVLNVSVSGTASSGDSLIIVASGGEFSVSLNSSGGTNNCTTYSDSVTSGYPNVEVTGATLVPTDFKAGSDTGLTFSGQVGANNSLDLSSLASTPVTVSVPAGTVTIGANHDTFSGIANFVGAQGNTTFVTGDTGGYGFTGLGSNNVLDLSGAPSGVAVSASAGTVTGLTSASTDTFSGIARFIGSTSGATTLVPGASALSFQGQGNGNVLDLSSVSTSSTSPLTLNVSGGPAGPLLQANDTAVVGLLTLSFDDVSSFTGPTSNATFLAGANGSYAFNAHGTNNVLDLSGAPLGVTVAPARSPSPTWWPRVRTRTFSTTPPPAH